MLCPAERSEIQFKFKNLKEVSFVKMKNRGGKQINSTGKIVTCCVDKVTIPLWDFKSGQYLKANWVIALSRVFSSRSAGALSFLRSLRGFWEEDSATLRFKPDEKESIVCVVF